ncbi:caspase family protein [Neolewinella persica]|uniref:caspase family protein n=1 Tax=Neolewinella persica TaxID=70998 RepID=UPI0003A0DC62|nr:caspase family protein [Neolewinella persica]
MSHLFIFNFVPGKFDRMSPDSSRQANFCPATPGQKYLSYGRIALTTLLLLVCISLSGQSPELVIPANHGQRIFSMDVSPDGKLMASCAGTEVRIWDYKSGKLLRLLDLTGPEFWTNDLRSVAFSAGGRHLAAISGNRFYLIDADDLTVLVAEDITQGMGAKDKYARVSDFQFEVGVVAAHPDRNEFYYEARYEKEHRLIRYEAGSKKTSIVATFAYQGKAERVAKRITFSPDGNQVLVTYFTSDDAVVVGLNDGKVTKYPGGQYWLPNGNLLLQRRLAAGLSLAVYKPDGTVEWTKSIAGIDLKVGSSEYYDRHWGNLAIDEKTQRFYYGFEKGGMVAGNYVTGEDVVLVDKPGKLTNAALTMGPNSRLLVSNGYPSKIAEADAETGNNLRYFGVPLLAISNMVTDVTSPHFALSSHAGENKLVQLTPRGLRVKATGKTQEGTSTAISPGGQFAATISLKNGITWLNGKNGEWYSLQPEFPEARAVALDVAGNMVVQSAAGFSYFESRVPTPKWSIAGRDHPDAFAKNYWVAISPDGEMVVVLDFLEDEGSILAAYSTKNGKLKWQAEMEFNNFTFSQDGRELIGVGYHHEVVKLNANNGKELSRTAGDKSIYFEPSFSADGALVAGTSKKTEGRTDETIEIVGTKSLQVVKALRGHISTVNTVGFLPDDFFLSAGFDNTLRLWDLKTGVEMAKFFLFDETNDWVILSPNGRFDATPAAMKHLYYVLDKRIIPLEQFYEGFYTPGLLGQLLDRKNTPAPPSVNIGTVAPPPKVTLQYVAGTRNLIVEDDEADVREIQAQTQDAKLVVKAVAPQSDVAEIRLYHNGKLVGDNTRNLTVEEDVAESEKTFNIVLLPGTNDFRAVAINTDRTESSPALLRLTYTAPAAPPKTSPSEGITLHLMTIGINSYKNPRYNLNYAEADARGLAEAVTVGLSGIVGQTKAYHLRNEDATRQGILQAIQQISESATPEDVFVFYYAGHGVMSEGAGKDFYLIPWDVTQLYGNDQGLASKAISAQEMKQLAAGIPAQKQLYILDACQSAGAVQSIAYRGAAEEKAIAQLARSTGTHWLTASGSEQFANEFDELGHGAFTFVLLEALAGKASGSDLRVTVNELKAYLDEMVPEITQKHTGQAQYPASYGFGQDFPVSVRK